MVPWFSPTTPPVAVPPVMVHVQKPQIPHRRSGAGVAEQSDPLAGGLIDGEIRDGLALAVESPREGSAASHRREARTSVPGRGRAGIDVAAERIGSGLVVVHILQVIDRVDQHGGLERGAAGDVAAKVRLRRSRVLGGVDGRVAAGRIVEDRDRSRSRDLAAAERHGAGTRARIVRTQHDTAAAGARDVGVDRDVAIGAERQRRAG